MTIPELFEAAVADAPDKPWLFFEDDSYTYGQARERIAAAAAGFAERGVGRGDIVLATRAQRPVLRLPVAGGGLHRRHLRGR